MSINTLLTFTCLAGQALTTAVILGVVAPAVSLADFPLARGGRPATIVVDGAESKDPTLAQAIADLRSWLGEATSNEPALVSGGTRPAGPAVLIGKAALSSGLELDPAQVGFDGYALEAKDDVLALAGPTPEGTANAIYDLASAGLGVRVHGPGPDGVTVPRQADILVPSGRRVEHPALALRQAWYNENVLAGVSKADRDAIRLFARRHRSGGIHAIIRHYFADMIPAADFFAKHPEYYAEINGKRVADGQLCLSNPDVVKLSAEHWIARFKHEPDLQMGSLSPNDGGRFCACASCKRDSPDLATRYVRYANEVTRRVAAEFPDRYLSFYAYAELVEPPYDTGLRLNANLVPVVARYSVCQVHAITDAACSSNAKFRRNLEGWAAISRQIMARDYACLWPVPDLTFKVLSINLRAYRDLGAQGMSREYLYRGFMSDLLMAVDLELQWNPAADAETILADLAGARFGPKAPDVLAAMAGLKRTVETIPPDRMVAGDSRSANELYSVDELAAAVKRLDQLAAGSGAPYRARIEREARLLEAAQLQVEAMVAVDRYKRSGADAEQAAAQAKLDEALALTTQLGKQGAIGANAASDMQQQADELAAAGLKAPISGAFDYEDDLARGGFSRRDADQIEGFYPGTYGLSLNPGKNGRVAYTFTAAAGRKFARVELHDLVLRGTSTKVEVMVGDRLRPILEGVALDRLGDVHDLTPIVGGTNRFTLIFWAQNNSDQSIVGLDHLGVSGEVR